MVWNRQGIKKIKIQSLYKFNIIDRFAKLNFKVFKDKYRGKSMLFLKKRWKKLKVATKYNYINALGSYADGMVVVKKNYKLFFFKENSKKFVIDFFENADLMPKLLSYPNLNQFFKVTAYFFRVVQLKQSFVRRNVDFFLLDGFFKRKKLLDLDYLAFTKDLIFKSYISKIVVLRKVIINKVVLSLK